jgi:hypothetical protein
MACGVCARSTRRAASLPGEGSTHLRGCGMTAVGTFETRRRTLSMSAYTAWRLTVNVPSSAGAKVTLVGLQAGIG